MVLFVMLIRFDFFQIVTEWNHNQYAALLKYDATLSCVHNHQLIGFTQQNFVCQVDIAGNYPKPI